MTLTQQLQDSLQTTSDFSVFLAQLKACKIVDIGRIKMLLKQGSQALVELCDGSKRTIAAEVISLGAFNHVLETPHSGQYCLLFFVATPISLVSHKLNMDATPYSYTTAKCLPIGVAGSTDVRLHSSEGALNIDSDGYIASFAANRIDIDSDTIDISLDTKSNELAVTTKDGATSLKINADGVNISTGNTYDASGKATSKASFMLDKEGMLTYTGNMKIDGELEVTGNFSASGGNLTSEV